MALAIYTFDLPLAAGRLQDYERMGQEWVPRVLRQPGVVEFRAYRHPHAISPQVMVQVEFDSLVALDRWHASPEYHEVLGDFLLAGCRIVAVDVWDASPVVPRPVRASDLARW